MGVSLILCFILLINVGIAQNSIVKEQLSFYTVESDTAVAHTQQLIAAQKSVVKADYGEEIIFALNNGLYVQFADGTSRRLLISRGTGYTSFMYPAWSLDGKYIAFAATRTDPRMVDLIQANADGTSPQVILTLDQGYFKSFISSISWSFNSEYIMFNYTYDDSQLNSLMMACTIRKNGGSVSFGSGFDRSFCKYEPVSGSKRYAYISTGNAFTDKNTKLHVSNLDGTNDVVWFTYTGAISGLTHIEWNNSGSIYTIIRNWDKYPNREVLLRINRSGGNTSFTEISYSDPGKTLYSPTLSPDRKQMYTAEASDVSATLWLASFGSNGSISSIVQKGTGLYPNWRQIIPPFNFISQSSIKNSLAQNYPNPFNVSTQIDFYLIKSGSTQLVIYNIAGREVTRLLNEKMSSGQHTIQFTADDLPSGTYFYQIKTDDFSQTRKMILLK
jgi:hypothetical protein